jgi:hypothetical protein
MQQFLVEKRFLEDQQLLAEQQRLTAQQPPLQQKPRRKKQKRVKSNHHDLNPSWLQQIQQHQQNHPFVSFPSTPFSLQDSLTPIRPQQIQSNSFHSQFEFPKLSVLPSPSGNWVSHQYPSQNLQSLIGPQQQNSIYQQQQLQIQQQRKQHHLRQQQLQQQSQQQQFRPPPQWPPVQQQQFNQLQSAVQPSPSFSQSQNSSTMGTVPSQRKLLFVSKLQPSTTDLDLINFFITYMSIRPLSCHQLKPRLNYPPTFTSFKVELNYADFTRAMMYPGWPQGVIIREFMDQPNSSNSNRLQLIGTSQ